MFEIPHIKSHLDADGHVLVVIDDYELYDFVDDHLTETHDLECLWVKHDDGARAYTITYPGALASQIYSAVSDLDPGEVHRIWLLNNSEES